MQVDGKIVGKVFEKGPMPGTNGKLIAIWGIGFNGDSVKAVEAVIEELTRQVEVVRAQGF